MLDWRRTSGSYRKRKGFLLNCTKGSIGRPKGRGRVGPIIAWFMCQLLFLPYFSRLVLIISFNFFSRLHLPPQPETTPPSHFLFFFLITPMCVFSSPWNVSSSVAPKTEPARSQGPPYHRSLSLFTSWFSIAPDGFIKWPFLQLWGWNCVGCSIKFSLNKMYSLWSS